ncbi:MAG TPA: YbaY family lipoprotein, partial [Steroidobacteraceae bacterium]
MKLRLGLVCLAAMLGACAEKEEVPTVAEITGTATYRERIMPPPDATLDVVLEDVTRADAPAEEIVRTMQRLSTAPPYSISIWFDPARIIPNHRYNVRAKITAGGKLWFISDTAHPVLGPKDVRKVDIVMRAITEADTTPTPPSVQFRGMYSYMADAGWFVECLSGSRMAVA